jgi:hypothetical protein
MVKARVKATADMNMFLIMGINEKSVKRGMKLMTYKSDDCKNVKEFKRLFYYDPRRGKRRIVPSLVASCWPPRSRVVTYYAISEACTLKYRK